ncbi:hypothetical protein CKK33_04340 [Mucilaginibacter sp. MD40]|uniref:serine hydrolase domain-containing protein n=1 Tax=Mucilaginibacter sp. MD40 TaxID=2029590 RepID=UPI000BACA831|nr:serine hydrolase domain-containing protein [Mucilaginibacter sp. MD40]PAW92764.1 hypothetical protein CKK33_04340 [Mucilaginibacter sp. MD40]
MFKNVSIILFLCMSYVCYPKSTGNKAHKVNIGNSVTEILKEELAALLADPHFSAVSGAVCINGKIIQVHKGMLARGKKPDNKTLYEIGSITKTYTGLLLSQAVYSHKLNLDTDIRIYLRGSWPNLVLNNNQPVTLRHLITHTAGLPMNINCNDNGISVQDQLKCFDSFTKKDFFENLSKLSLQGASGNTYQYSNAGVQLVGYILEDTYRMPFSTLLKKYIFSRSGERETIAAMNDVVTTEVANGKDSLGKTMPLESKGYLFAGGLKASATSMGLYMKMYLESRDPVILQAEKLLAGNQQYGRAYAWNTYNFNTVNRMLYHNGGTFGTSSWIAVYPQKRIGIFLVTNVMTGESQRRLNEVSNRIFDRITNVQVK